MSSTLLKQLVIVIALVALCMGVIVIKHNNIRSLPYFDPADGDNLFWTEAAFHFRHTRMIAEGGSIPPIDTQIQYPEGLDTRRYITPVMDHVYGRLHRWFFRDLPLHYFLVYAVAAVSTLAVVACFFAGCSLGGNTWVGLICASLYGLAPASWVRSTAMLGREDFALPLLFGSFACFLSCMRKERTVVAVAGAALTMLAFASWHISQFFYQMLVVWMVLVALLSNPQRLPRRTVTIYAAATVAAALLMPVLRAKYYALSVPLMLNYALLILLWLMPWLDRRTRMQSVAARLGLFVIFSGCAFAFQRFTETHSHVFAVLWAKIRYLGTLPMDPLLLPFEAKAMWVGVFASPSLQSVFVLLSTTLLFAVIGLIIVVFRICRRKLDVREALIVYFALVTLALFLTFDRLSVFAVFFLALLGGLAWPRRDGRWRVAFVVLFTLSLLFEVLKYPLIELTSARVPYNSVQDVTDYLGRNSNAGGAVVCAYELGPSIAAYADRPVLLHSKFESKALRDRVEEVYTAFFEDEKALYDLCRRYDARYVVYQVSLALGRGRGSPRYAVGHRALSTSSVAFRMHFLPEHLKSFLLLHQNHHYRIYAVGRAPGEQPLRPSVQAHYHLRNFVEGDLGLVLTDDQIERGLITNQRAAGVLQLVRQGRYDEAILECQKAMDRYPYSGLVRHKLVRSLMGTNHFERIADAFDLSFSINPDQPQLHLLLNELRTKRAGNQLQRP